MIVTLNRPEALNTITEELWVAVGNSLEEAETDPQVRVVLLTAVGDRAFCAGADLKLLARGGSARPTDPVLVGWGVAGIGNHPISKPIIAAANGVALGGGFEILLACDLIVAAENARFGLPEVKVGQFASAGGAFRLPRRLPHVIAMEMILTGEPIDARRALELGLVNRVVPSAQLMPVAIALAEKVATNAPLAIQTSKQVALAIGDGKFAREASDWVKNEEGIARISASEDAREGARAFAEKRAPIWTAR
jgi:crotonobetainyl-CoA hydratase